MLNYNKIESSINFNRTPKTVIAKYLGIAESTLRNRLERKNLTPNDVAKLAEFFNKPIAYYFDKEDNDNNDNHKPCLDCEEKQKEIEKLKACIEKLWKEKDEVYRKYTDCLEELLGKKGNSVKNSA